MSQTTMNIIRTYTELTKIQTFEERFKYLKLGGYVGLETFGFERYLNQMIYHSDKWKLLRDKIIVRDNGCDLAMDDYDIREKIIIHHMNPITINDMDNMDLLFNPEYLIATSHHTHNAIHYGDNNLLPKPLNERTKNDTCPWRK